MLSETRANKGGTEPSSDGTPVEIALSNNLPIIKLAPWLESVESRRAKTDNASHMPEDLISRSSLQKDLTFN